MSTIDKNENTNKQVTYEIFSEVHDIHNTRIERDNVQIGLNSQQKGQHHFI